MYAKKLLINDKKSHILIQDCYGWKKLCYNIMECIEILILTFEVLADERLLQQFI